MKGPWRWKQYLGMKENVLCILSFFLPCCVRPNILRVWHSRHLSHFIPISCSWWAPPPPHFITCQWVRRERHSRRHCWASAARQCNLLPSWYSRILSTLNFVAQFNHVLKLSLKLRNVQFSRLRVQVRKKITVLSPQSCLYFFTSSCNSTISHFKSSTSSVKLCFHDFLISNFQTQRSWWGRTCGAGTQKRIQQFTISVWRDQYPSMPTSNEIEVATIPSVTAIPEVSQLSRKNP